MNSPTLCRLHRFALASSHHHVISVSCWPAQPLCMARTQLIHNPIPENDNQNKDSTLLWSFRSQLSHKLDWFYWTNGNNLCSRFLQRNSQWLNMGEYTNLEVKNSNRYIHSAKGGPHGGSRKVRQWISLHKTSRTAIQTFKSRVHLFIIQPEL